MQNSGVEHLYDALGLRQHGMALGISMANQRVVVNHEAVDAVRCRADVQCRVSSLETIMTSTSWTLCGQLHRSRSELAMSMHRCLF